MNRSSKAIKLECERKAGRPPKFNEKTTTFACRVPISKKEELSQLVKTKLVEWEISVPTTT